MSAEREQLANLYFSEGIIQFGSFKITAHADRPDLPPSPFYMHLPKPGDRHDEPCEQVVALAGQLLAGLASEDNVGHRPLVGIPNGGSRLAQAAAIHSQDYPSNIRAFTKVASQDGTIFLPHSEAPAAGELLCAIDDHTSGARTAVAFARMLSGNHHAWMTHLLNVVDREQGGRQTLAALGISMKSIFTITQLMAIGLAESHVSQAQHDDVLAYVNEHQVPAIDWRDATAGSAGNDR